MYKDTDIALEGKTQACADNVGGGGRGEACRNVLFRPSCVLSVVFFSCPEEITFTIHWYLKYYSCHNEFHNIEVNPLQNVGGGGGL